MTESKNCVRFLCFLSLVFRVNSGASVSENITDFHNETTNIIEAIRLQNKTNLGDEDEQLHRRSFFPPDLHRVYLAVEKLPEGLCKNHSEAVMEAVINHERWALQMFDSSPKFPVGMLYGSHYQLGNYDECVTLKQPEDSVIQGQYCLAEISLHVDSGNERYARSNGHFIEHGPTSRLSFNNTLNWAICVPSSCGPEEVKLFLNELFKTAISHKAVAINIPELKCHYDKEIPFTALEIIYGSLIAVFAALTLIATAYHITTLYRKQNRLNYDIELSSKNHSSVFSEIILSFSIIKSIRKLLHITKSDLDLDFISGIKFIFMLLIIASHSLLFVVSGAVMNEEFYLRSVRQIKNAIFTNNPLLVDVFLLVGAFLMCRLLLIELEKRKGRLNFAAVYIGRYIRLTPAYVIVIGFYCTFLIRLDSGPMWDTIIKTEQDRCLSSWWTNLLYINNYVNTDKICMFQSWYLSADTHLFIIAPLIIYPLWRWPKAGEIILGLTAATSVVVPFVITYVYELDPTLMGYPAELYDITTNEYYVFAYIKTHMRATPYCVGLISGYIVHRMQSSNIKISRSIVTVSWILATIFGVSSVFSIVTFYHPEYQYSVLESASYSALHKLAWSIFIGWIIIACATDNSGFLKRFLSWAPFLPLSRLTYCAYLMNGLIELHQYGTLRAPIFMSVYNMAGISLAHFVLTFVAGFILCVLFESPIHSIEKILLGRERRKNTQQQIALENQKL